MDDFGKKVAEWEEKDKQDNQRLLDWLNKEEQARGAPWTAREFISLLGVIAGVWVLAVLIGWGLYKAYMLF
jgi:hypothetical protein